MNELDVVVVGGGAAGLSAALVLSRSRRRVAVVDAGEPRNAPASHMHGFVGWDGAAPADLVERAREEVRSYGAELVPGTVTDTALTPDDAARFRVGLADGRVLRARRLLVATGLRDELPDVPGVRERWGRDLLHCPYCHGHEVQDQRLGVLGGPDAVAHALLVRQWSPDVVYFTHDSHPTTSEREQLHARAIGVVEGPVARLVIDADRLTGVELASGQLVPRDAVFVRPRFVPNSGPLLSVGCAVDDDGWVITDGVGRTSVPGVWAAGNAVNPRAQVVTAAGEGSAAAIAVNNDLVEADVAHAVREHRAG